MPSVTVAISLGEYASLSNESTNLTVSKRSTPEQGKGAPARQIPYSTVAANASEKNKKLKKIKKPTIKNKETLLLNFFLRMIVIKASNKTKTITAAKIIFS